MPQPTANRQPPTSALAPDTFLALVASCNSEGVYLDLRQSAGHWEAQARRELPATTPRYRYAIGYFAHADLCIAVVQAYLNCLEDYDELEFVPATATASAFAPTTTLHDILALLQPAATPTTPIRRLR